MGRRGTCEQGWLCSTVGRVVLLGGTGGAGSVLLLLRTEIVLLGALRGVAAHKKLCCNVTFSDRLHPAVVHWTWH